MHYDVVLAISTAGNNIITADWHVHNTSLANLVRLLTSLLNSTSDSIRTSQLLMDDDLICKP